MTGLPRSHHPLDAAAAMTAAPLDASRRAFLVGACGLLAAGLGSALLADDAQAASGIKRRANGQVDVTVAKVPALAKVGGAALLGNVKGVPTAVVRTGQSTYQALNLRCTHQGVPVTLQNGQWSCPAHGSAFAIDGAVTNGPAQTSLASVKSVLNKGVLTVA
ncbi:MAG: Rieske 2Fe-2S domain-containing protein [Actinomycetales bacterium]|nr:Rieske 2Fe-2S domain-containing protein [Actinomycetales bacterium]